MKNLFLPLFLLFSTAMSAQNNVGIGTLTPDTNALLELKSFTKGLLPPRIKLLQRDAMQSPAQGMTIYNVDTKALEYYNGDCWIPVYATLCDECYFTMALTDTAAILDRVVADSVITTFTINQINGDPQYIAFEVIQSTLPAGVTAQISPNPSMSNGSAVTLIVRANNFAPAGTFPVVVRGICGPSTQTVIYSVTIEPCYLVTAFNSGVNFNVADELFVQNPTAPTNEPICIQVVVPQSVDLRSDTVIKPAFTLGNIYAGSTVGISVKGTIIGKGGNGGRAIRVGQASLGAGLTGGDAIELTDGTTTELYTDDGYVFGGGGGGSAAAYEISYTISVPVIGSITFGILVGAGGGGGAGEGLGGVQPTTLLGITEYQPGQDGTGDEMGAHGNGGTLNYPKEYNISVLTIKLLPQALGGRGGDYGQAGTKGVFSLGLSVLATVPILGTIPVLTGISIPLPLPIQPAGQGGYAVKKQGGATLTNYPDDIYTTSRIRGRIGQ